MTNAEKYIGDEDLIDTFIDDLSNYMFEKLGWYEGDIYNLKKTIECFFKSNIKPTLTEDERVILRNIKGKYTTLYRNDSGYLILQENSANEIGECFVSFNEYNHLFQFIKERRRI